MQISLRKYWFIITIITINFLTDVLNNFLLTTYGNNYGIVIIIKGFILFLLLINISKKKSIKYVSLFSFVFLLRGLYLNMTSYNIDISHDAVVLFRFFLLIISLIYFNEKKVNHDEGFFQSIEKLFLLFFIFQSISIIIGFLFEIDYFRAYDDRDGYKGLFWAANDTSFFMAMGLFYIIKMNKKKIYKYITIVAVLILGMGSKTALFSLILIPGIITTSDMIISDDKKKYKKFIMFCTALIFIGIWAYMNAEMIIKLFLAKSLYLLDRGSSIEYVIFTGRVENILASFENINSPLDFILGYENGMIEIDSIDFLARMGVLGILLLLVMLHDLLKINFHSNKIILLQFIALILIIGNTTGHVLLSGMNSIWISFFISFYNSNKEVFRRNS